MENQEHLEFIRLWYAIIPTNLIANCIDKSETFVRRFMKTNRLVVPADKLKEFVAQGRFKKGQLPWLTGMKGLRFAGSEKTWFKKGQKPKNTLYDGAITIRKYNDGTRYQFIRLANRKWVPLHQHLWKQHYGAHDPELIVVFKNKNTMDCRIDNLEVITRSENMKRNTIHRFEPAVYLHAAEWLFHNPTKRCDTAILSHRTNEWHPNYLNAGRVFDNWIAPTFVNRVNFGAYEEDGFQENKTDLTPEHLLERKIFALLLMYEFAKDLYTQGELI